MSASERYLTVDAEPTPRTVLVSLRSDHLDGPAMASATLDLATARALGEVIRAVQHDARALASLATLVEAADVIEWSTELAGGAA